MSYFTEWTDQQRRTWPNWLENIDYPTSGVGDLSDLSVHMVVGQQGKWLAEINPGWYYNQNAERYRYIVEGYSTISAAVSGTASGSFNPAWAPVLMYQYTGTVGSSGFDLTDIFRQHHSGFYPQYTLTWYTTTSSGLYYADLPAASTLAGLRDLTTLPLGSVPSTGSIINDKLYWYDRSTGRIYARIKNYPTPSVWADIIYHEPRLRFREVVVQTESGVLPSYSDIIDVRAYRGTQSSFIGAVTGTAQYITHALTGVANGDWVVLDYYIRYSYIVRSASAIDWYGDPTEGSKTHIIYYETSPPLRNNIVTFQNGEFFNCNPLHQDAYRAGYLLLTSQSSGTVTSAWKPGELIVEVDKLEVCSDWAQPIVATIRLNNTFGLPIPQYPVTVVTTNATALIGPTNGLTDNRGEMHYTYIPTVSTGTVTVSALVGYPPGSPTTYLTTSATSLVLGSSSFIDGHRWVEGSVWLVPTTEPSKDRSTVYCTVTQLDGVPKTTWSATLRTEGASEFELEGKLSTSRVTVVGNMSSENLFNIQSISAAFQPNDRLIGYSGIGQSPIINTGEVNS